MFWIHTFVIEELLKPPLKPLTEPSLSSRTSTFPKIARFEHVDAGTLRSGCAANSTLEPVSVVYHSPAPCTVTLFTFSGELILYVPCGSHTVRPEDSAALIAFWSAWVESFAPVASALYGDWVTLSALAGAVPAAATV